MNSRSGNCAQSVADGPPPNKKQKVQAARPGNTPGLNLTDSSDDDHVGFGGPGLGTSFSPPGLGTSFSPPGLGTSFSPPGLGASLSPPQRTLDAVNHKKKMTANPQSFRKATDPGGGSSKDGQYSDFSAKMMAKMGYKGKGLGKNEQGRVNIVEASMQKGRRGLGHSIAGFEQSMVEWDFQKDEVRLDEQVEWIPTCTQPIPTLDEMTPWIKEGPKKRVLDDESQFCTEETLADVIKCKSVFDNLEDEEMRRARTRSNPYETIRGAFFLNRAAMKMANMDAVTGFMFTNPQDDKGHALVQADELLYFADVCAGPGGFSEYVLWRKKWEAKGFGFTLKGPCDFKLEDFFAASSEFFEPHYGVGGVNGDGDIYQPENLRTFRQFVWDSTNGAGLHFVMADGGFSVEGQENIQEILSKRLYLCQFMCALSVLRVGGHFVCKLFDIFTPFSVGLIYLMYRAFTRVSIFKPVTSRPANSERYIICQSLRPDSHPIHDYMFEVNLQMAKTFSATLSDMDIVEVVPHDVLVADEDFYSYVFDSNETMGKMQAIALVKIQTFAQNNELRESRQADTREQLLKSWEIPDKVRTAPERSEQPISKFQSLTEGSGLELNHPPTELDPSNLHTIHSVHDYRCVLTGSDKRWFLLGLGKLYVWKWDGQRGSKWAKVNEVRIELPRDTLIEAEFVQELRGEGKGQRRVIAVHVIDAMFLCGVNIQSFHYKERLNKVQKFIKAIHRPSRIDLAPIRVKDVHKLEEAKRIFDRLEMKLVKGSGTRHRVCYQCGKDSPVSKERHQHGLWTFEPQIDQPHFIVPSGLMLLKTEKDPWMLAFSRSRKQWYWYNTKSRESLFQPPKECIGDYAFSLKSRLLWKWDEGVRVCDQQTNQDGGKLSRDSFLDFIKKLNST